MITSGDGEETRVAAAREILPLAWSPDGAWIYGLEDGGDGPTAPRRSLLRVSVADGAVERVLDIPIDEQLDRCAMSRNARHLVCVSGWESDVHVINDFDRVLSAAARSR